MPTFAYSGRTRAGQVVSGERVADTMDAAVAALRREQIMVTRIDQAKGEVKEAAGKVTGDAGMEAEGHVESAVAGIRREVGEVADKGSEVVGDVAEKAKDVAGDVVDKAGDVASDTVDKAKEVLDR